jgi:hypothetical protein
VGALQVPPSAEAGEAICTDPTSRWCRSPGRRSAGAPAISPAASQEGALEPGGGTLWWCSTTPISTGWRRPAPSVPVPPGPDLHDHRADHRARKIADALMKLVAKATPAGGDPTWGRWRSAR